jgi:hypothetical protein
MPSLSKIAGLKEFSDLEITCRDCNKVFIWTEGEQDYYNEYHLFKPSRCPECRKKRKLQNTNNTGRSYGYKKSYPQKKYEQLYK